MKFLLIILAIRGLMAALAGKNKNKDDDTTGPLPGRILHPAEFELR